MTPRRRAAAFVALALVSALASAGLSARSAGDGPDWGEPVPVLVAVAPLARGEQLSRRRISDSLATREIPQSLLPPAALSDADGLENERLRTDVPAGSYLLAAHLGEPTATGPRGIPRSLVPVELTVSGAGALGGRGRGRVDVLVTWERAAPGRGGVEVAAEGARLLDLRPERGGIGEGRRWRATLALRRAEALAVIEAESFAREIRLLPRR